MDAPDSLSISDGESKPTRELTAAELHRRGHYIRQPEDTHVVSYWHVPGGYDYVAANGTYKWFADEESARQFAKKYEWPPESAILLTAAEYDSIQERTRQTG